MKWSSSVCLIIPPLGSTSVSAYMFGNLTSQVSASRSCASILDSQNQAKLLMLCALDAPVQQVSVEPLTQAACCLFLSLHVLTRVSSLASQWCHFFSVAWKAFKQASSEQCQQFLGFVDGGPMVYSMILRGRDEWNCSKVPKKFIWGRSHTQLG